QKVRIIVHQEHGYRHGLARPGGSASRFSRTAVIEVQYAPGGSSWLSVVSRIFEEKFP
ncbi:MAG: hypothetical protein H6Q86_4770, partial [candidate division NC10 bacterium]|nr:hypothetical protein [candidate division NC10 bacterium]